MKRASMKRLRIALISLGIVTIVCSTTLLIVASIWPTINYVETGKTIEYPELLPKTYQLGYDRIFDEALGATEDQAEWELLEQDRAAGTIKARATMDITGWTQQIEVKVEKRNAFVSRVHVTSHGDDAPGDLGQNARNIERYLASLDARLGASSVD